MLDNISKIIAAFSNPVVTPITTDMSNANVIVIINQLLKSFNKLILHRFVLKVIFTKISLACYKTKQLKSYDRLI